MVLHQIHFIVTGITTVTPLGFPVTNFNWRMSGVKKGIKQALNNFGYTSAILSSIIMSKHNCITKEKFDELYKTNEESEERTDLSVGEDLETFIGNIKTGKINRNTFPTGEDH